MSEAAMKRVVEAQNKLLLAQIEAENAQLLADSQSRHDRRHHNLVMLEFAKNNDIESVREYLTQLMKSDSAVWGEVRHCVINSVWHLSLPDMANRSSQYCRLPVS